MAPGKTLLEILEPDESRIKPFINAFWGPFICGGFACISICAINWASRRPVFSGIQKHIAATAAGGLIGKWVDDYRYDSMAERDAVLRHYVTLHPDDFPVPDRVKFADVFQSWIPIR